MAKKPMDSVVGVRLPKQLLHDLEVLARECGMRRSELIRLMLRDSCRRLAQGKGIGHGTTLRLEDGATNSVVIKDIGQRKGT